MLKILGLLLGLFLLLGCITYNPNYMQDRNTIERIDSTIFLIVYGGIMGASIVIEVMEN